MITRRHLLRSSVGAAVALSLPGKILALEPPRANSQAVPGGPVDLSSNENAYGPLPGVQAEMLAALSMVHRYPDSHYDELWEELARLHGAKTDEITLGCGSNDLLRMAADALCTRTRVLVQAAPSFEALAMYHRRVPGATVVPVPLRADYAHDLDAMLAKAREGADLIYICNPNNPTATLTPRAEIEAFLAKVPPETYVLIDEAYHHFAVGAPGYVSFADKRADHPRVFVLRTFSKIFGLAGLRVGYAVGPAALIDRLSTYRVFDNPNVIGVRAAIASLRNPAGQEAAVKRNAADREELLRQANARGLKTLPSHANFVMFDTGRPIRQVIDHCKSQGVRIGRPFPPYDTYARVSLGLPEDMRAFWKAWDALAPGA